MKLSERCQCTLTTAGRLRLIPLWVFGVHTLDSDGALLQRVARLTGELHHRAHAERNVTAGEVAVLHKWLVACALGKS